MTIFGGIMIFVGIMLFGLGVLLGEGIGVPKREIGPHCPACGFRGCTYNFDPKSNKVNRICKTCGCTVTQPPVYPDLFKDK
jgi:hypothetical protein